MTWFETVPLMLLGMALFKSGFFPGAWDARRLRRWAWWGVGGGLALTMPLAWWLWREQFPLALTLFVWLGPSALGRLASAVAQLIRGKHKPSFTPHMDGGDFVVVINAEKVRLTGRKLDNKKYFSHTGYMGHERMTAARDLLAKHPDRVIEKAVFGMLPKTSLARQKLRGKLKVYGGAEHPHAAQQPKPYTVNVDKVKA
jgi:large subunit ribosomal protein L13